MSGDREAKEKEQLGRIAYEAFTCTEEYKRKMNQIISNFAPAPWNRLNYLERQAWEDVAASVTDSFRIKLVDDQEEITKLTERIKELEEEVNDWKAEAYAARGE